LIGSLRGRLLECHEDGQILLEVAGVGYRVAVTPATAHRLTELANDEIFLQIHHHIREADQALFGFLDDAERACFEALLATHGVGPSLALAVLGVHDSFELARVVADGNEAALCLVPGVGKKTAARLLVLLKDTLPQFTVSGRSVEILDDGSRTVLAEVQDALEGLGYSAEEVRTVVADLVGDDSADLLREALRRLARS